MTYGAGTVYTDAAGVYHTPQLPTGGEIALQPAGPGRFFLPSVRLYQPLSAEQSGQNFIAALYGDVSGNERISAFDGSLVLRVNAEQDVSPYYLNFPRDSIAADVSANRQVSPFDASLIFRRAAGLIDRFPAEKPVLGKQIETPRLLSFIRVDADRFECLVDGADGIYAGEFVLEVHSAAGAPISCSRTALTAGVHLEFGAEAGRLKVAFASLEPLAGGGALFEVHCRHGLDSEAAPRLTWAQLNEDQIPVRISEEGRMHLRGSAPNPFNHSTTIYYNLDGSGERRVKITIYNLLGQAVRVLLDAPLSPGAHDILWDGRGQNHQAVPSGIYLVRLGDGVLESTLKICLVR